MNFAIFTVLAALSLQSAPTEAPLPETPPPTHIEIYLERPIRHPACIGLPKAPEKCRLLDTETPSVESVKLLQSLLLKIDPELGREFESNRTIFNKLIAFVENKARSSNATPYVVAEIWAFRQRNKTSYIVNMQATLKTPLGYLYKRIVPSMVQQLDEKEVFSTDYLPFLQHIPFER